MPGSPEAAVKAVLTKTTRTIAAEKRTGLVIGCEVTAKTTPRDPYNGRRGVVLEHNAGEVGVDFGGTAAVWFLPHQLIKE